MRQYPDPDDLDRDLPPNPYDSNDFDRRQGDYPDPDGFYFPEEESYDRG